MPVPFHRIAVVGTGLIGGSFALAVRTAFPGVSVSGWDKRDVLRRAYSLGAVHYAKQDLGAALADAELVFIGLPVGMTIERLPEIARLAPPGALVTDAASTKRLVCEAAKKCFSGGAFFLGGHPMAGQERSGIDVADRRLFRGARYALIGKPGPHGAGSVAPDDDRAERFVALLEAIGAHPVWMDAAAHDRAVAVISHLPQLLSVALASLVHQRTDENGLPLALAGRGLRDTLRLAGSPYNVWRDIVLTNSENIDAALDQLIEQIEQLRSHLRRRELEDDFAAANEVYRILREMK
jgi:prephenate dehydrogenase